MPEPGVARPGGEVVLLGSGGWIPTSRRATCSALIRAGEHALVIDAGTGLARMVEDPGLLDGVREIDIVLTHFHLDHVVGLAYLPALPLPQPPRIQGPGKWLYGAPTAEILARVISPPLFAVGLETMAAGVGEVPPDGLSLGPLRLRARVQRHHNHPTLALRVDDELTYCTDTSYDHANVQFARGSRILAHEAWYTEDAPRDQATHSSAREAAITARDAGVEALALIHIRPGADEDRLAEEARSAFKRAVVGSDLLRLA
jgi:ribonuclease BN (tRNA processing enzyme)